VVRKLGHDAGIVLIRNGIVTEFDRSDLYVRLTFAPVFLHSGGTVCGSTKVRRCIFIFVNLVVERFFLTAALPLITMQVSRAGARTGP
jgi:hypothetical protein